MSEPGATAHPEPGDAGTAQVTTTAWQRWWMLVLAGGAVVTALWDPGVLWILVNVVLAAFFLAHIVYRLAMAVIGFVHPALTRVPAEVVAAHADEDLPRYTVLVPLYRESEVVPRLVLAMGDLDYPVDRLEILFLVESDDPETRAAFAEANLLPHMQVLVVPPGEPKTKPRACNHGLGHATGDMLVIFDAEDRPEPDQLRKAAVAFSRAEPELACLQARLNYYNADWNWLTRCFALEYTTWYGVFLPGWNRMGGPIFPAGTSNHFRLTVLRGVGGWDAYNVTEDADLGMRLFRLGYRVGVLDSTTWEEASSGMGSWVRQRSRWVKGHVLTHLVHTRLPTGPLRRALAVATTAALIVGAALAVLPGFHDLAGLMVLGAALGLGSLALGGLVLRARRGGLKGEASFLLNIGGGSAVVVLHVVGLAVWAANLVLGVLVIRGDVAVEAMVVAWSPPLFATGVVLLVGYVALLGVHFLGAWRLGWTRLMPFAAVLPVYWLLMSWAGWRGFLQLFGRAHFWEKTTHGVSADVAARGRRWPRAWAWGAVAVALASVVFVWQPLSARARLTTYVTRQGDVLFQDDQLLRFASYNVPSVVADDSDGWRVPDPWEQEDALATIARAGGKVVRLYPLSVGTTPDGSPRHVTGPGTLDEELLVALDRVLLLARTYDLHVIIPLVDQSSRWGGIAEYAAFRGLEPEDFWTDPQLIEDYEATLEALIQRENVFTGERYRRDPTILAWETGNRLKAPDEWTSRIAATLKELDPNHLVMEGSVGISDALLADPNVDIVSNHYHAGLGPDIVKAFEQDYARARGRKPLVAGEVGLTTTSVTARFLDTFARSHAAGVLLWRLQPRSAAGGHPLQLRGPVSGSRNRAYRIPACPSGDAWGEQEVVALVTRTASRVGGLPPEPTAPPAPVLLPSDGTGELRWRGSAGAEHYLFERARGPDGPWEVVGERISGCDDAVFRDRGAEPLDSYHYRVVAVNRVGASAPSNVVQPGRP